MSSSHHVTVWRDGPGKAAGWTCDEWFDTGMPNAKLTRADARSEGWRYRTGKDYCPQHVEGRR